MIYNHPRSFSYALYHRVFALLGAHPALSHAHVAARRYAARLLGYDAAKLRDYEATILRALRGCELALMPLKPNICLSSLFITGPKSEASSGKLGLDVEYRILSELPTNVRHLCYSIWLLVDSPTPHELQ